MATVLIPTDAECSADLALDRVPAPWRAAVSRVGEDAKPNGRTIRALMRVRKLTPGPVPPGHIEKVVAGALAYARDLNAPILAVTKIPPRSVRSTSMNQGRAPASADRVARPDPLVHPVLSIANRGMRQGRLL